MHVNRAQSRSAEQLLDLGFRDVGAWVISDSNNIEYHLDAENTNIDNLLLDQRNSLYAFVVGDKVKYIGKTARTVRRRFVTYKKPGKRQRTNLRCNANIRKALGLGVIVRILVFNPISFLRYGEFEINLAAALEDSLIAEFDPPWNGRERGQAISEEAEREESEDDPTPAISEREPVDAKPAAVADTSESQPIGFFKVRLRKTYFDQGSINVGVDGSAHLGQHGELIGVSFADGSEPVISRINRTANPSGGVRIVGNNPPIARWFHKHFKQGDTLEAHVLDRNRVRLLLPTVQK